MSHKYRLWCESHGWVYKWSNSEITQCPITPSDTVDVSKIFKVGEEFAVITASPTTPSTNNIDYTRLASIMYNTLNRGLLNNVKVLTYMDNSVDSYDIEIRDDTNYISLFTVTGLTNTGEFAEHILGPILIPPEDKFLVGIYMKKSTKKGGKCYLDQSVFYTRREST
jgi:hypothetical protein